MSKVSDAFAGRFLSLKRAITRIADRYDQDPKKLEPFRLVEVGVYRGDRAVAMMNEMTVAMRGYRDYPGACYIGFDLFENLTPDKSKEELSKPMLPPSEKQVFDAIMKATIDLKAMELVKGDTTLSIPNWVNKSLAHFPDFRADLIFLDGGHSLATVNADWVNLQPLIGPNTIVVLDDYYDNRKDYGCRVLVDEIIAPSGQFDVFIGERMDRFDHTDLSIRTVTVTRKS